MPLTCNIDAKGKAARLVWGILMLVAAAVVAAAWAAGSGSWVPWAVAAALAREPSLLIADEVTSMVDQEGRDGLIAVLSALTKHHRMSLVHITHYNNEADSADRTIGLTGDQGAADNTEMDETTAAPAATAWGSGAGVAVLCNLVNNLPAGLMAGSVMAGADASTFVRGAVAIGIDLGPNLSVTGSLASTTTTHTSARSIAPCVRRLA